MPKDALTLLPMGEIQMANPNYDQRRREAANEGRLHDHGADEMDWTDRDRRSDNSGRGGESDQRHHRHQRRSDEDRQRNRNRTQGSLASQQGRDRGGGDRGEGDREGHDRGHTNRYGSRSADDLGTSRSPRIDDGESGSHDDRGRDGVRGQHGDQDRHTDSGQYGGNQHGDYHREGAGRDEHHGGQTSERRYGSRRNARSRTSPDEGNPHEGSQRGSDRGSGLSGRMGGQRGTRTFHSDPSNSRFRDETESGGEHRHGGDRGTSERDRRYGSRRGHGSERRTDRRPSSH